MARVKIEEIIGEKEYDIRRALVAALKDVAPDVEVDGSALFRAFRRAVHRNCSTWERVSDRLVEAE